MSEHIRRAPARQLSREQVMSRSAKLGQPAFEDQYERHLAADGVILVCDCDVEIGAGGRGRRHRDLVVALTTKHLVLLRGRRLIGARQPWRVPLPELGALRPTSAGDLEIRRLRGGQPHLIKLRLADPDLAELWMGAIDSVYWLPRSSPTAEAKDRP